MNTALFCESVAAYPREKAHKHYHKWFKQKDISDCHTSRRRKRVEDAVRNGQAKESDIEEGETYELGTN